jgi:putative membrane protein
LLSGLFGISTLLYSLNDKNKIPEQKETKEKIQRLLTIKALASGCLGAFLTAVTPGLGAGMASVISSQITRKLGDTGFMILVGSISTFNMILSLVTYYILNKARNGSIIAVQKILGEITLNQLLIALCIVLISGSIAVFLALIFGKLFLAVINKVNYRKLVLCIITFIIFLTIILSSWHGIIILITSTSIGLIPAIKKTSRTMGMGCLILPVLVYLFG